MRPLRVHLTNHLAVLRATELSHFPSGSARFARSLLEKPPHRSLHVQSFEHQHALAKAAQRFQLVRKSPQSGALPRTRSMARNWSRSTPRTPRGPPLGPLPSHACSRQCGETGHVLSWRGLRSWAACPRPVMNIVNGHTNIVSHFRCRVRVRASGRMRDETRGAVRKRAFDLWR
jgi:hypothetical protein